MADREINQKALSRMTKTDLVNKFVDVLNIGILAADEDCADLEMVESILPDVILKPETRFEVDLTLTYSVRFEFNVQSFKNGWGEPTLVDSNGTSIDDGLADAITDAITEHLNDGQLFEKEFDGKKITEISFDDVLIYDWNEI